jgi:hypothetical protein
LVVQVEADALAGIESHVIRVLATHYTARGRRRARPRGTDRTFVVALQASIGIALRIGGAAAAGVHGAQVVVRASVTAVIDDTPLTMSRGAFVNGQALPDRTVAPASAHTGKLSFVFVAAAALGQSPVPEPRVR